MKSNNTLSEALVRYSRRTGAVLGAVQTVLFDMDGVLYDSMPGHAYAWKKMCDQYGIDASPDEFFAYEGRTGASTINILFRRQFGRDATEAECKELYGVKTANFKALGLPSVMAGAKEAVAAVLEAGAQSVLVTGSGQSSILDRLAADFPGAFKLKVTAADVVHGKPDPEPYLRGLQIADTAREHAVAIDNAPLGVESASRAGIFTVGVRTGKLPEGALIEAGADIELNSMTECAILLSQLL